MLDCSWGHAHTEVIKKRQKREETAELLAPRAIVASLARAITTDATGSAVADDRAVTPLGVRPVASEVTGPAVRDGITALSLSSLRDLSWM